MNGATNLSKHCRVCKLDKPLSEFHKDSSRSDGYSYVCKSCRSTHRGEYYEKHKERLRAEYDPVANRNKMLLREYGISLEDYEAMYLKQNGCCAICQKDFDKLHVDHCHNSGKVRGLLCSPCNTGIGLLGENRETLGRAIAYLGGGG